MWNNELAREILREQGRTTKWLADQCGIGVDSLRNCLRGAKPSLAVIKLMSLALNCSEEDLKTIPPQKIQA